MEVDWGECFYFDDEEQPEAVVAQAVAELLRPDVECAEETLLESDAPRLPVGYWLMDTGCGHDLVDQVSAKGCSLRSAKKLNFGTANGSVLAQTVATFQRGELNQEFDPRVLPSTPRVLSIGRRCMEEGCSFAWSAGKAPVLYLSSGRKVELSL